MPPVHIRSETVVNLASVFIQDLLLFNQDYNPGIRICVRIAVRFIEFQITRPTHPHAPMSLALDNLLTQEDNSGGRYHDLILV